MRELGSGATGIVYEAVQSDWGLHVAIKVLHPTLVDHEVARTRLLREAYAASQIGHRSVVRVFDLCVADEAPYIVMELLRGENLAVLLDGRKAPLGVVETADLFLPVVSAVAAAHAAGVIHRDLKPANIVLADRSPQTQEPVITDFGTSKLVRQDEGERALTASDVMIGTLQYMAPEQMRGARHASEASDQYAIGAMLYECVAGRRPFTGDSPLDLMQAVVAGPLQAPSHYNTAVPRELDEIITRAIARDPRQRFPDVAALGSALLSLASRRAWALWGPEFVVDGSDVERTLPEDEQNRLVRAPARGRTLLGSGRKSVLTALVFGACGGILAGGAFVDYAKRTTAPHVESCGSSPTGPRVALAADAGARSASTTYKNVPSSSLSVPSGAGTRTPAPTSVTPSSPVQPESSHAARRSTAVSSASVPAPRRAISSSDQHASSTNPTERSEPERTLVRWGNNEAPILD